MIKQNDIIELEIEKLTYEGAALGRYFCDDCPSGFVVFVKEAAPKDRLKVKITKLNKTYAKGEIVEIIEPSKHRIKPFCPLFRACGGCCYQYLEYDYLLEQKNNMLKEAFLKSDFQADKKSRAYGIQAQNTIQSFADKKLKKTFNRLLQGKKSRHYKH